MSKSNLEDKSEQVWTYTVHKLVKINNYVRHLESEGQVDNIVNEPGFQVRDNHHPPP